MSIQFTASSRMPVADSEDPFKKYWWAILFGFVLTGAWLCLPVMETSVGSTRVDTSKPAFDPNSGSSLDSLENPGGAPGSALDLSMDGLGGRKSRSDEVIASMLYQAPAEVGGAAAAGKPLGASSGSASLAQQLKSVGAKKAKDASGWSEKAQRGFTAPHLSANGMSGLGSTSGGSGASASASSGIGAFGAKSAEIGFGSTHGLHDDGSADGPAPGGMQALRSAAKTAAAAAAAHSNDVAKGGAGSFFDGSKGADSSIGGPGGNDLGGAYEALDAAPTNLKMNDPKMDKKELKPPPATDVPTAADDNTKQMMMMLASTVVGGLIGGTTGQMVMMMGTMMMQQQASQAAEKRAMERQKSVSHG